MEEFVMMRMAQHPQYSDFVDAALQAARSHELEAATVSVVLKTPDQEMSDISGIKSISRRTVIASLTGGALAAAAAGIGYYTVSGRSGDDASAEHAEQTPEYRPAVTAVELDGQGKLAAFLFSDGERWIQYEYGKQSDDLHVIEEDLAQGRIIAFRNRQADKALSRPMFLASLPGGGIVGMVDGTVGDKRQYAYVAHAGNVRSALSLSADNTFPLKDAFINTRGAPSASSVKIWDTNADLLSSPLMKGLHLPLARLKNTLGEKQTAERQSVEEAGKKIEKLLMTYAAFSNGKNINVSKPQDLRRVITEQSNRCIVATDEAVVPLSGEESALLTAHANDVCFRGVASDDAQRLIVRL